MPYTVADCQGFAGGFSCGAALAGFQLVAKREQLGGFGIPMMEANRAFLGDDWDSQASEPKHWDLPAKRADVVVGTPPCSAFSGMTAGYAAHGSDSKINECMWELMRYAARVRPAVVIMESVSQAYTSGAVLMARLAAELCAKSGLRYHTTHVLQDNYSLGGVTKRKRYFLVLSQVPFGVEMPQLKWLPVLADAFEDLRGLELKWEDQKIAAAPTWWSSHLRSVNAVVDGHSLIQNSYTRRQSSLVRYPVRWEEGDKEADVLRRYYDEFGELPEEFHYGGSGKHKGVTRDKVLIDRGLDPGGFSQARCWPRDEPGRVINGAGPYMVWHYAENRLITNREAARVMGFPDAWKCGSLAGDKQLSSYWGKGTSVAPAEWVMTWLRESLDGEPGGITGELLPDGSRLIDATGNWKRAARILSGDGQLPQPREARVTTISLPRLPEKRQKKVPGQIPGGFLHRDCDRMITREVFGQRVYDPITSKIRPSDVVLDLGAHIGCFSRVALDAGAVKVVSVEMLPDNVAILRKNLAAELKSGRSVTCHGAVTGTVVEGGLVTAVQARNPMGAYVNGTKRLVTSPGQSWQVEAVPIASLLQEHRPSVVKFDIETSEYGVINPVALAAAGIRLVSGELHHQTPELTEKAKALHAAFEAAGYRASRQAPSKPSGWGTLIHYELTAAAAT